VDFPSVDVEILEQHPAFRGKLIEDMPREEARELLHSGVDPFEKQK
jgi:hypothetical protein